MQYALLFVMSCSITEEILCELNTGIVIPLERGQTEDILKFLRVS